MLTDLKKTKSLSWDQIEGRFPHRTRGSLQVHYSKKLKGRGMYALSPRGMESRVLLL